MKYAIVENEHHSLTHIRSMLEALRPEWELSFTADSVGDTLKCIASEGLPDLLFLDIELNDGNSFKLFERIDTPVPVIFTTAYDEFCLKAFKVHSLDYLLKPITTDALLFAIRKYETLEGDRFANAEKIRNIRDMASAPREETQRILIPSGESYRFVNISDIAWFECEYKCVSLTDRIGREHITTFTSLNEIESILPSSTFFRISRSVVVSIDSIKEVHKSFNYRLKLHLQAGTHTKTVELSSAKKKDFLSWFGSNKS